MTGTLGTLWNFGDVVDYVELAGYEIFKEVSMGGRFGKYGDAKRKAQIRKNRLRPPAPQQRGKDKPLKKGDLSGRY